MDKDAELVLNVWDAVRDVIPASKREDSAISLLKVLEDHIDLYEIAKLIINEDKYLDVALRDYTDIDEDNDDYSDGDDDY